MQARQIVLDTETTGLDPVQGHRVIEIGCVELVNRRLTGQHFHQYLQPDRQIDPAAIEVHGITNEFLTDKPRFAEVAQDFLDFVSHAELIIHNAPFDVGFLNHELKRLRQDHEPLANYCEILDTLGMARRLHPGQRNSLDALCKRYAVDNAQRTLHGALLDAEILADVYLAMTGGQVSLSLVSEATHLRSQESRATSRLRADRPPLRVLRASAEEETAHQLYLDLLDSNGQCLWKTQTS